MKKISLSVSATMVIAALIGGVSVPGAAAAPQVSRVVAPGVMFYETVDSDTPLVITAVKFHPSAPGVKLRSFVANDAIGLTKREMVSSAVKRSDAVAGINGDFFPWTADPLGLTFVDGRLVSEPWPDRPVFAIRADGKPLIGLVKMSLTIHFDNGLMLKPNGIDRPPTAGEMIVFEKSWGTTTGVRGGAAEMLLKVDWVKLSQTGEAEAQITKLLPEAADSAVPENGVVVVAKGPRAAEMIKAAEGQGSCRLQLVLQDEDGRSWLGVTQSVGGEPMLLKGGKLWVGDGTQGPASNGAFSTTRHPRTAAGITRNGSIILVVVDGRQVTSRGASLKELAQVMSNLGCTDAVNLDGGGSSTMVVRGLVVNSPSDGQQRLVASGLLVHADSQHASEPASLALSPASLALKAGDSTQLKLAAAPEAKLPPDAHSRAIWGTLNGGVFIDQKGSVKALRSGAYKAGAYLGGVLATADLTVTAAGPGKMALAWDDATPPSSASRKLKVTVKDNLGNVVPFPKVTLTVTGGTADPAEIACGPDGIGWATITWDAAATTRSVSAAVGDVQAEIANQ